MGNRGLELWGSGFGVLEFRGGPQMGGEHVANG